MKPLKPRLESIFPAWRWLQHYHGGKFKADLLAALIVIAMLVPQGMAYAIVAGLPPITGLYASVLPMIIYAMIGGSPTLSIGPVALISMMTFATLNPLFEVGSPVYIQAACLLAVMVGVISLLLGIFKFGFLIRLISHPVIKSFIIASAVLIALSQVRLLIDVPLKIDNLSVFLLSFWQYLPYIHVEPLIMGSIGMLFLIFVPRLLRSPWLSPYISASYSAFIIKALPLLMIFLALAVMQRFNLQDYGIKTVGDIPSGFPPINMPFWSWDLVMQLLPGALMIAMVSFVESISIAQATAFQNRSALNSNQELVALGLANLSAGLSSSFPVTGSLSRTVVNADAGARTPMAGVISSIFIVIVSLYFTGVFRELPLAILAATIMVSIWKLVDFKPFIQTWRYSKADGIAMWVTFFGVLFIDISTGLIIGIVSTFVLLLWRISRPHIAVIGLIEGTQHFRNIHRHQVMTRPEIVSVRIDESLTFLNINSLNEFIISEISQNTELKHVILNCSSVSNIDLSALEMLEDINTELHNIGVRLHFSEVKGPVMDRLNQSQLILQLHGQVFLTHYQAVNALQHDLDHYIHI
ncbi:SulP family sulfate permease [Acinetobacter calcoaceticus]|uniref:SulP family sulfate permease n=1 Tax=Acinetobacter calcoaceticus TaxID=471 RepID=A0A4R1XVV4_ACICA|nr:SulP family sulfate permease [Acinetobacter calcoaceticus]